MMETAGNEELNKTDDYLLSAVSHELRTPIATIKGYATMLVDYLPKLRADEIKEYIRCIDNAADRLNRTISNLQNISQLDAGTLKLETATVDVARLVKTAVKEARAGEGHPGIAVKQRGNSTRLSVDQGRIRQVLDNLIEIAAERSPPDETILISIDGDDTGLTVGITDRGPEIPSGELARYFDLMDSTGQKSPSRRYGTRLGLYVSRRLIEAHGGRVRAISAAGKGNTVQFSLPATTQSRPGE